MTSQNKDGGDSVGTLYRRSMERLMIRDFSENKSEEISGDITRNVRSRKKYYACAHVCNNVTVIKYERLENWT